MVKLSYEMKNSVLKNLKLYPHFKITDEEFPRLLITRKIENDNAEYFGAFLPKSGARMLFDFINKTFRLRNCEIDINGEFLYPCPMFYRKRCLAPCVENICDKQEYFEMIKLLRLFLKNEREILEAEINIKINEFAEKFDYENAAKWRDFLFEIEKVWKNKRWRYRIDDAIDTWEIENGETELIVNLITQRGRKILGRRSIYFDKEFESEKDELIRKLMLKFYQVYIPKEIRILEDFPNSKELSEKLSNKFGRKVQIKIIKEITPTTKKGFTHTKFDKISKNTSYKNDLTSIKKILKQSFDLPKVPKKIEVYDVAHISGTNVVAAKIVWNNGKFQNNENEVWNFNEISEPDAIRKAVEKRFETKVNLPDLIIIDGGRTQLKAALKSLENFDDRNFKVISAVKPTGKHNQISHFLDEDLQKIEITDRAAFQLLTNLRDTSHNLANQTHAMIRDSTHFYEPATLLPDFSENQRRLILQKIGSVRLLKNASVENLSSLFDEKIAEEILEQLSRKQTQDFDLASKMIPIRYDAPNGNAEDLQPIDKY